MRKNKQKKIVVILLLLSVSAVIIGLVLYALNQNINLYFTPEKAFLGEAPLNKTIKLGGMVKENTILKKQNLDIEFVVTDFSKDILVKYHGILPDLFKEKQGVVMIGELRDNKTFFASQVLAKHDEKYMPREVAESLKET